MPLTIIDAEFFRGMLHKTFGGPTVHRGRDKSDAALQNLDIRVNSINLKLITYVKG